MAALVGDPKPGSPASASGSCSASVKRFTSGAIAATTVTAANADSDPDGIHSRGPIKPYSLRGKSDPSAKELREQQNADAIGGMRNPARSVSRIPKARATGRTIFSVLKALLLAHVSHLAVLDSLGTDHCPGFPTSLVEQARHQCASALGFTYNPANTADWTDLRPDFVENYVRQAEDPEVALSHWLRAGCPLGIRDELEPSGIFPAVNEREKPATEAENLYSDAASFANYASLAEWPDAAKEQIDRLASENFIEVFDSYQQMEAALGEKPILSKLALISKERPDGTYKHRLIVDLLRSEVNAHISQGERIVLPRVGDAVKDALKLRRAGQGHVECMVTDFADAFFMLPLSQRERRFVTFEAFGKWYIARVLMFGAKSSPTLWGRCAAFLARSAQSLFDESDLSLQLFVDDTIAQARGSFQQRRLYFGAMLLWWCVLGAKIAWHKGALGPSVDWIGAHLLHNSQFVTVSIKKELLTSTLALVKAVLSKNVVAVPTLRTLTGKLSFISGIVPTMRPFIAELWAAIAMSSLADAAQRLVWTPRRAKRARPTNSVWLKQVVHGLRWVEAFLERSEGNLQRTFLVDTSRQETWAVWCDASPFGLGAVLVRTLGSKIDIVEYLATPLYPFELNRFGLKIGDPAGQAVWEALTVVVAARAWRSFWTHITHTSVAVRSDSLAALNAARKLSSSDPKLNTVMQELALLVAIDGLHLGLIEHTPGLANVLPDRLSRRFQGADWRLPAELQGIKERVLKPRMSNWWVAKGLPARHSREVRIRSSSPIPFG